MDSFEVTFGDDFDALARASAEARDFLARHGAAHEAIHDFELVLEELSTNAIKYAFAEGGSRPLRLSLSVNAGTVSACLVDNGRPFDPRTAAEPARPSFRDDAPVGGHGLSLVRRRASRLDWRYEGGCNVVTFEIRHPR